jgi:hypothetical protein
MSNDLCQIPEGYSYGFFLIAGDTSHDGNCISSSMFVFSTHSMSSVRNAFKTTNNAYSLEFMGEFSSSKKIRKKSQYYSEKTYSKLIELGLMKCFVNPDNRPISYEEYVGGFDSETPEGYAAMYLSLAKLSLPELHYRIVIPDSYYTTIDLGGDILTNDSLA